ncbi:MAG: hypothetical protein CSA49_01835 [Gammaproteobacteria bacterium]|nr:MAG: hypothetical protein CSA49_01835 [Gammaproteobacteria bacterium]
MLKKTFFMAALGLTLAGNLAAEESTTDTDSSTPPESAQDAPPQMPPEAPPAQTQPPLPPRKPPLPLDRQKADQLASQLQRDQASKAQIHWFNEGSDEQFLGLYIQEYGEQPQGYALILHDNQQHPDWPGLVRALRTQLPAGGWSTLAISLPDRWDIRPHLQPDQLTDAPPTLTQLSVEALPEEVPQIFKQRVTSGFDFLESKDPMPIIVISIGTFATIMAKQTHKLPVSKIAGLVVIDPTPLPGNDFNADADVTGLQIPVLDIAPQLQPRSNPAIRKRNAKRESRRHYEQYITKGSNGHFQGFEFTIVKKIRGWGRRVIDSRLVDQ